jgi:hypothetical protein
MMIKHDYAPLTVVILIVISIICGFGYMLADKLAPPEQSMPTSTPQMTQTPGPAQFIEPTRQAEAEQAAVKAAAATATQMIATAQAEATQIAEAGIPVTGGTEQQAAAPTPQPPQKDPADQEHKALLTILYSFIFLGAVVILILAIAIVERVHNDAYLRQQEVDYYKTLEQRRLAELRTHAARRVREGTVQPPLTTVDLQRNKSNGNGRAARKLPLGG